jgi:allantoate deiminase
VHKLDDDAIAPNDWLGYFEIHIEQGPVLYEKNIPVAVVVAIAAQKRARITFTGVSAHAGTIPMDMRNDALCAAAEFILTVERFALEYKHNMVATIGKLDISHAASNVIPGKVICTLDARSADETALAIACDSIKDICHQICLRRNISFEWNIIQETQPVACDQKMNTLLSQSIAAAGYEVVQLVSGAGHDAVPVSQVSPVAMLFVKCYRGISHNPLENVEVHDIAAALNVADRFIEQLIKYN